MSTTSSPQASQAKKKKAARLRTPSASEIARNLKNFEIWATHMNCEQISFSDIPASLREDVESVFDLSTPRLPASWVSPSSAQYKWLSKLASPEFLEFIDEIYEQAPYLFGESVTDTPGLFAKMTIVHSAWMRLTKMSKLNERRSEADYAANVYNVFRSPALRGSTLKVQCTISLPNPLSTANMNAESARVLGAKTACPDCLVMMPAASIQALSLSATSPFQILKRHPKVRGSGTATKGSSFRFQITPCATPPSEAPAFQFISSAWEDKKPVHQMLGDAYRQNRMATTASVRHLHSLHIVAPVFGLVWARGTVRAHVDWCGMPEGKKKPPVVYSAPYRVIDQENNGGDGPEDIFHEWRLDRASDIVQVFFLIENIDHYTTNSFRQRITRGLERLVDSVVNKDAHYVPWKRVGELAVSSTISLKENHTISVATSSAQSTPPKPRDKGKQRQK